MLKHELSHDSTMIEFTKWFRTIKKPFVIANPGIGDAVMAARMASYLGTAVFHDTDTEYREKFSREFCKLINVPYFSCFKQNGKILDKIYKNQKFFHKHQITFPQFLAKKGNNVDITMKEIYDQTHGLERNQRTDKKIILICPCASNRDDHKKRYMTRNQLSKTISFANPEKNKIYLIGIDKDIGQLGHHQYCEWLNSESITKENGLKIPCSMSDFINIIGQSSHVVTMDTFLTHITSIFKIPTTVVYKYNQKNEPTISPDANDKFFLNPSWYSHIQRATYEELYSFLEKGIN